MGNKGLFLAFQKFSVQELSIDEWDWGWIENFCLELLFGKKIQGKMEICAEVTFDVLLWFFGI